MKKLKYLIAALPCRQCIRDTGNPVYHSLSALVGLYVTVVEVN